MIQSTFLLQTFRWKIASCHTNGTLLCRWHREPSLLSHSWHIWGSWRSSTLKTKTNKKSKMANTYIIYSMGMISSKVASICRSSVCQKEKTHYSRWRMGSYRLVPLGWSRLLRDNIPEIFGVQSTVRTWGHHHEELERSPAESNRRVFQDFHPVRSQPEIYGGRF